MEKPVPPRLEDFGLSEPEYRKIPKLLCHRLSEKFYTYIGFAAGACVGIASFLGFLDKMESSMHGWYFGIPIGFVVFLMATFISTAIVDFLVKVLSAAQKRISVAFSDTARRAILYDDAMEKYRKKMAVFESQYN